MSIKTSYTNGTIRYEILAEQLEEDGDYASAEHYLRQVIDLKRKWHGYNSSIVIANVFNLGLLCWAQDKNIEAGRHLQEALRLARMFHGSNSVECHHILDTIEEMDTEEPTVRRLHRQPA